MSSWKEFLAGLFIGVLAYILMLRVLLPSPFMALTAIFGVAVVVGYLSFKFGLQKVGAVAFGGLTRFLIGFIVGSGVLAFATLLQILPVEVPIAIVAVIVTVIVGAALLRWWRAKKNQTSFQKDEAIRPGRDRKFERRLQRDRVER